METLARAAGVQMLQLPFKNTGALLVSVASGEVDVTPIGMPAVRHRAEQAGFALTRSSRQALRTRVAPDLSVVRPSLDEGRITRF